MANIKLFSDGKTAAYLNAIEGYTRIFTIRAAHGHATADITVYNGKIIKIDLIRDVNINFLADLGKVAVQAWNVYSKRQEIFDLKLWKKTEREMERENITKAFEK